MLGLGKQPASKFEKEYERITKEFEQALAEGDSVKEEELRDTFSKLYQELYFESLDEE